MLKKVSALTNVRYKSVRYIEVFPWEFDRDSVNFLKKCPLLAGVRYIAFPLYIGLTVFQKFMKGPFTIKFITILTEFSRNTNADLAKNTTLSTVSFIWLKKIKHEIDNNNVFAVVLTNLSKRYDCINHEFLIAKLNPCGFDSPSLKFMSAYSIFRKQKTNGGSYSVIT